MDTKFVQLTIPVSWSSERFSTSTPMTCSALSFQGQYLRQLLVDTSSHEYLYSWRAEKSFMLKAGCKNAIGARAVCRPRR